MTQPSEAQLELSDLLEHMLTALVDKPDEVTVSGMESTQLFVFDVRVAPEDFGKVIGKKGRNADSIRNIMASVATRLGKKCKIDILDPKSNYSK